MAVKHFNPDAQVTLKKSVPNSQNTAAPSLQRRTGDELLRRITVVYYVGGKHETYTHSGQNAGF
jgi:hypothetical protein